MALTKVTETVLLAIVSTASNGVTNGAALDVSTYYGADIRIRMGRGTGTAFTTSPIARVQVTYKTSPTVNDWSTVAECQPAVGATLASQAVSGTVNAGQATVLLAAGTNFAAGDYVFFHNGTLGNSEWGRVLSVSSATLTMEENLAFAQTGATARDQSEEYHLTLDLTAVQKLRVVIDANASGQACIFEAGLGAVTAL